MSALAGSPALTELLGTIPSWCAINHVEPKRIILSAHAIQKSGKPTDRYELEIKADKFDGVTVREVVPQNAPEFCPTRHINEDGWFCVGLGAGKGIVDTDSANQWWRKLEVFLLLQQTAINRRIWPPELELSHGTAGEVQELAETTAAARGLTMQYEQVLRDEGSLFGALSLMRRVNGENLPLLNGRATCVCRSVGKRSRLKLRRECWATRDNCLVRLEIRRRRLEQEFISDLKAKGFKCCGTMDSCPFADR